ncbi:MAG: winged helix-turn-helix transcriptional regulator [Candidatus Bathyarchaeota archaeon]|nr:MAG: winged helix-turn-helix transcriptional regulator [Candidatus Bathyarchaeota archaeon]
MGDPINEEVRDRMTRMLQCGVSSSQDVDSHLQELHDLVKKTENKKVMKRLSRIFKAIGDEKRLSILRLINNREMCVCEIMAALDLTQPTASHHLGILERSGLAQERREGRWVFYSVASPLIINLLEAAEEISSSAI